MNKEKFIKGLRSAKELASVIKPSNPITYKCELCEDRKFYMIGEDDGERTIAIPTECKLCNKEGKMEGSDWEVFCLIENINQ